MRLVHDHISSDCDLIALKTIDSDLKTIIFNYEQGDYQELG